MRFLILLLLFSGFCAAAFAQGRVRGKVLEVKTYKPVEAVTVENLTNRAATSSDAAGSFSVVAKKGDLLRFSSMGYRADTVYLKDLDILTVYLIPQENMLGEVKVKELEFPPGAFAMPALMGPLGSKVVRYQTDKAGNPIGGLKMSLGDLFGGGKKTTEKKLEIYKKQEQIARVFNATTLGKYLPFQGQELKNFVILYMPDVNTFYDKNFNITEYISVSYRKFMEIPEEKRRSKELVELK
ncbi:hypothetical protein ACFQZS_14550 [Mucilaginibacter calamicampi]|uniref:CarboxypepD_reg-like domain-containing protein n=1 Tax=Mucilaginibacter calamicampi TaxID=1302352 RepID=A0ABW2YYC1_9SPHI